MHPSLKSILRYFVYDHLPPGKPREVAARCSELAWDLAADIESSAELVAGLRKLLEAKDCFVRAVLPEPLDD